MIANIKRYAMRNINLKHMTQQGDMEFKGTQEECDALVNENKEEPTSILREIMSGETVEPEPWGVTFSWKDKSAKVKFKNGEDILKLAEVFSQYLTANGIENTLEKQ